MADFYATGGTLPPNAPSYVPRQADTELYQALKQGQFCYILNSRQMGKSSLAAQVAAQLRQDGMKVVQFELQLTYDATPEQWYNTLLTKMGRMLGIRKQLDTFWRNNPTTPVQRWMQAIHEVILTHFKQPVILCIDEIDIVRSLPFATDDFFAAIRSCYNERAQNPDLQRLTFCLVGTARPTDLMTDAQATPFDIGQAIELTGFTFAEAMPLAQGLQDKADNPEAVLRAILEWTGGQPFLTQKVCDFFWRHTDAPLASGQETAYVEQLIQTHIIEHWQDKDDPPHLLTIRDRLIKRDNRKDTWQLLKLCSSILSLSQPEDMLEAQVMELRLTGLMVKQPGGQLQVFNKIYEQVFNQHWLAQAQRHTLAENPYLGLSAFQAEDAERFFGREQLTAILLEKCRDLDTAQLPRLLPILGPSGSGKSSVARAGLMPALQRSLKNVQVHIFTPTETPLKELARIVASIQAIEAIDKIDDIEQLLRTQNETLLNQVATVTTPLVLLIDQFEEVYTLCENTEESTAFINNLITAVQSPTGLLVILTLRSDFLGATQRHGLLNQIIARQAVIVPMMNETELRAAISKPAEQAKHPLELATVDLLVEQAAGREGALPLLQFALSALWEGLRQGSAPAETLRQMGGVGGALAGKAEAIYQSLSEAEQPIARRAFLKLIQLGEGTKDTRRRVKMTEMVAHGEDEQTVHAMLSRFAHPNARLVTLSQDKQHHKTAEVTHEALLDNWQTLKDWLADSRDDLRFEHRLNDAINNWQRQQQAEGLLWRSPDLDLLQKFYQQHRQDMTHAQINFFEASVTAKRQAEERERQFIEEQQRLREEAERQAKRAKQERNQALRTQSLFLAYLAQQENETDNFASGILLALEALPKDISIQNRPYVIQAEKQLHKAVYKIREYSILQGHEDNIFYSVFSPNGNCLVTVSHDNTARLWNVNDDRLIHVLTHNSEINHVAFNIHGNYIITSSSDCTACLWNTNNGELINVLEHGDKVNSAIFDIDNTRILTASNDKTARLYDIENNSVIKYLYHDEGKVNHAIFTKMYNYLITTTSESARLWNVDNGQIVNIFWYNSKVIYTAFCPHRHYIATSSESDNIITLWNISSGQKVKILKGHNGLINHITFSPNGAFVVTASDDNTARLWSVDEGQCLKVFKGHEGPVYHAAFNNKGTFIVTSSDDNTTRLWNAKKDQMFILQGHQSPVNHAAFNQSSNIVVTSSNDNTARLWNMKRNRLDNIRKKQMLIDYANKVVPRCLTPKQRKQFFLPPDLSYNLIEEGEQLAKQGDIKAATAKFKEAKAMAPCHKFFPEDKAREIAAMSLIKKGKELAKKGLIEAAVEQFKQAQKVDGRFKFGDIEDYARQIRRGAIKLLDEYNELRG
ncbi:MAG: hypothetical protein DRR08_17140 [Candidatus Parabeggiatoa sp. nov. 2]|nr:MAG: hypothetical protein B6247_23880 [Beggiatoa sp. 4572_84]RKZ58156.1 MAG: hypothetical protein DRR08_17140 [Gammaproteobacteria bacterium]